MSRTTASEMEVHRLADMLEAHCFDHEEAQDIARIIAYPVISNIFEDELEMM